MKNNYEDKIIECIKAWPNPWTPTYRIRFVLGLTNSSRDRKRLIRALKDLQDRGLVVRLGRRGLYKLTEKEI